MPDFRQRPRHQGAPLSQLGRPAHVDRAGQDVASVKASSDAAKDREVQDAIRAAPVLAMALSDIMGADRELVAGPDVSFVDGGPKGELSFGLTLTGVAPATYGAPLKVAIITVDDKGRVTAASEASLGTAAALDADNDATLAANSPTRLPTQFAVRAYVAQAVAGLLDYKGDLNCAANPNYPAAEKGDAYLVTAAGKVGGASGKAVDVGDFVIARADNAGGTEAAVGASWFVLEHNLAGALLSANNLADVTSPASARANLGLAIGTDVQAFDADLAALAALTATNVIYYRSAANTWTAVVIGSGLSFSGGTLDLATQHSSGSYTPTVTIVANLSYLNPQKCYWTRIGNVVTVKGKVDLQPTAVGAATTAGISLPIASNLAAATDLHGLTACPGIQQSGAVEGDATNDRASLRFVAQEAATRGMMFEFTYEILP